MPIRLIISHYSDIKRQSSRCNLSVPTHLITYCIAKNIDMELNLVVGKINYVLPNFILPTFNTCIKKL